jgi:hypothetical protein
VLPSLFILIALSWIYLRFGDVPLVAGIFYGIKPAVTALVLHAAHWRIGTRALKNRWMWGIAAASFVAIFAFDTPFPAIVLAAGPDRPLRRTALAAGVRAGRRPRRRQRLRAGADRRRHADTRRTRASRAAGLVQGAGRGPRPVGGWRWRLLVAARLACRAR